MPVIPAKVRNTTGTYKNQLALSKPVNQMPIKILPAIETNKALGAVMFSSLVFLLQAGVDQANAAYQEETANYQQTVLRAFKEVEDNLAQLRLLSDQTRAQDEAVKSAQRTASLSQIQYKEGMVSHLNVIDAQRSVLQQQRAAVQLDADRARATANLIRAIGGGWLIG